jgi:hypothetical protein
MIQFLSEQLSLPAKSIVDKRIPKKMFYEKTELSKQEIKVFTDLIESVRLVSILNKDSINIDKNVTEDYSYTDIAVICADISDISKSDRVTKIIHESVPNPLLLVLRSESHFIISAATKRLLRIEKDITAIEECVSSTIMDMSVFMAADLAFLDSMKMTLIPGNDVYQFYIELVNRIFLTRIVELIGYYPRVFNRMSEVRQLWAETDHVKQELRILQNRKDKETQFGEKMNLYIKIKRLEMNLELLLDQLKEVC